MYETLDSQKIILLAETNKIRRGQVLLYNGRVSSEKYYK